MLKEQAAGRMATLAAELGHGTHDPEGPASLIGLEHEYRLSRRGQPLDFRDLVRQLDIPGRRLDPGDANAYRLQSGLVLTCDGAEAEIASPPLPVRSGFGRDLAAWASEGLRQLTTLLPADVDCFGYSTHLSVSLDRERQPQVLEQLCQRYGLALMLLFDRPDGFGVYVRPRPGRIELCGDYLIGTELEAAAVVLAGGVKACCAALEGNAVLPPALDVRLRPATGRYGLYLGRRSAFGFDLYAAGREAVLPLLADAGSVTAREQLSAAWLTACNEIQSDTPAQDFRDLEAVVKGERALPTSVDPPRQGRWGPSASSPAYGSAILKRLRRQDYQLNTVIATWDFTVFQIDGARRAFACVPREDLGPFIQKAAAGSLDGLITRFLTEPAAGRRLSTNEATQVPGLWDELADGRQLLASEPDPQTGRYELNSPADLRIGKPGPGRLAKPVVAARHGKPLVLQVRPPAAPIPSSMGPNGPMDATARPAPVVPVKSKLPLLLAGVAVLAGILLAATAVASGFFAGEESAVVPTATATVPATATGTATATATLTSTPAPSVTPVPSPTLVPVVAPTSVPVPSPTPVPTVAPTEAPPAATAVPPTATPGLPCDPFGALQGCTPTPRPTSTATPTATLTPTPIRTPSPTATICIPGAGVACPTPSGPLTP